MRTLFSHAISKPGRWAAALLCLALSGAAAWAQASNPPAAATAMAPTQAIPIKPLAAEKIAPLGATPGLADAQPSTIAPDYKITPNDLLEIEVFGVTELKRTVRVNSTGHVALPLIGAVPVAGLTPADAEALIALQYGSKYLKDPQISIFIKEFTTQRITVDGSVVKPGIYPLTAQRERLG